MDDDDDYKVQCCVCEETTYDSGDDDGKTYETVCDKCDSDSEKKDD